MRNPKIGTMIQITGLHPNSVFVDDRDVMIGMVGEYRGMRRIMRKHLPKFGRHRMYLFRAHKLYLDMYKNELSEKRYGALLNTTSIVMTFKVIGKEK
jgi:hypothetical protein